jgi:Na+-transporting NADH:ubiquinone oxidoreductase subunit C
VSEPSPSSLRQNNTYTLVFMVILSSVCALILSVLASALREPQEIAREVDRSRQMLIAAKIMNPYGYFQIRNDQGEFVPAEVNPGGILTPVQRRIIPSRDQILEVYRARVQSFLVDDQGQSMTFEEAGINKQEYIQNFRRSGYYRQPQKLLYRVYANPHAQIQEEEQNRQVEKYVIPVNGMGLWDAIYGYLAIELDGNTVTGISWYDQKETPGLGANIAEPDWQSQFPGKHIFQASAAGKTNFKTAPLGIIVVRGRVKEVLGESPKARSAVDGIAGATLTGNGVTNAYRDVLSAYRPFLLRMREKFEQKGQS